MHILTLFLIGFSLFHTALYGEFDFTEYWQRVNWEMLVKGRFHLTTYGEIRTGNHFQRIQFFQLSEQLAYDLTDLTRLELHFTYIHGRPVFPGSHWNWLKRLEIEVNRDIPFIADTLIKTRNRLEIRKVEHLPGLRNVFRQRTEWRFPINYGRLKTIGVHNEVFYDFKLREVRQDRICPFQMDIEISEKMDLSVFVLIRLFKHEDRWFNSLILGSQLNF